MKYTVLISTTGRETIFRAIASVLSSSRTDVEIVIVLDGVDSEFKKKIQCEYKEFIERGIFKIHENSERLGLTASLNLGAEYADGLYISRLDDDDEFIEGRFELIDEAIKENNYPDIVTGNCIIRSAGGDVKKTVPTQDEDIKSKLAFGNVLVHSALNIKKSSFNTVEGYNEMLVFSQDYGLYLASIRKGFVFSNAGFVSVLYKHKESTTTSHRHAQSLYSLSALAHHYAECSRIDKKYYAKKLMLSIFRVAIPDSVRNFVMNIKGISDE